MSLEKAQKLELGASPVPVSGDTVGSWTSGRSTQYTVPRPPRSPEQLVPLSDAAQLLPREAGGENCNYPLLSDFLSTFT